MSKKRLAGWAALALVLLMLIIPALVRVALDKKAHDAFVDLTVSGPKVPSELKADLSRGPNMEDPGVGTAVAPLPRPDSYLGDRGYAYEFVGSPHHSERGWGNPPELIVFHVAGCGSFAGMRSWFNNPSSQVSAHFGVNVDGTVHQYVPLERAAWHAGVLNRPNMAHPRVAYYVNHGINPNRRTVGIEFMLCPGQKIGDFPKMAAAGDDLLLWLLDVLDLYPRSDDIVGHQDFDSVSRAIDPSCCIHLPSTIAYAKVRIEGAVPEAPATLSLEEQVRQLAERVSRLEERLGQ